jgi:ankyrin repeat protein
MEKAAKNGDHEALSNIIDEGSMQPEIGDTARGTDEGSGSVA